MRTLLYVLFVTIALSGCGKDRNLTVNAVESDPFQSKRQELQSLEGTYRGVLNPRPRMPTIYPVELHLNITEIALPATDATKVRYRPEMQGTFWNYNLDEDLDSYTKRALILRSEKVDGGRWTLTGDSTAGSYLRFEGEYSADGIVSGSVYDDVGLVGTFRLRKDPQ